MNIKETIRDKLNWWHLKEWQRQVIQQPLHVAMTWASVWVLQFILILPAAIIVTILWVARREIGQWPSSRRWDPYLDLAFQAIGILIWVIK